MSKTNKVIYKGKVAPLGTINALEFRFCFIMNPVLGHDPISLLYICLPDISNFNYVRLLHVALELALMQQK